MHLSSHSSVAAEQLNKLHEAEDELQQLGFHRKLASIHIVSMIYLSRLHFFGVNVVVVVD